MTATLDTIVGSYDTRRSGLGNFFETARMLEEIYGGRYKVATPEIDEREPAAVPNLIAQAIDHRGQDIASTVANVAFEPLRKSKQADTDADKRRRVVMGWLDDNRIDKHLYRRARWLVTYASTPVLMRWDRKRNVPLWELKHPLQTFPASTTNPDDLCPSDCIFTTAQSFGWLSDNYPDAALRLRRSDSTTRDSVFDLLEYVDGEETVLVALGDRSEGPGRTFIDHSDPRGRYKNSLGSTALWTPGNARWVGTERAVELLRIPNRTGICPAVVPGRIGLEGPVGQFDSMIGVFILMAKLMSLEVNAVARGVFPDTWAIERPNEQVEIIRQADGMSGVIGKLKGGDLKSMVENPGYQTPTTINYLERVMRQNGLIPAEWGGESASNVRTGRRGDAIMSATVDKPTQESQVILAEALEAEITRGIAMAKTYAGARKLSYFINAKGATGQVDYAPADIFAEGAAGLSVRYAHPGTNIEGLTIRVGQLLGEELISKQSAREQSPDIDDPAQEHDRIISEALEGALLASLVQQVQSGALGLPDVARIRQLVEREDLSIEDAVTRVHEEAQARQATTGEPGTAEAPAASGSPEAQPGITAPGSGAEAGTIGPAAGSQGLSDLLNNLRRPQRTTASENAPVPIGA